MLRLFQVNFYFQWRHSLKRKNLLEHIFALIIAPLRRGFFNMETDPIPLARWFIDTDTKYV